MPKNIIVRDLLRDIKLAEKHLRAARNIVNSNGPIADLYRELEEAQHASFDAKEHIVNASRMAS